MSSSSSSTDNSPPSFYTLESQLLQIENPESFHLKDNTSSQLPTKQDLPSLLHSLFNLVIQTEKSALFSRNEELDDIQSQNVKYLLLPYYVAKCLQLMPTTEGGMKQRLHHLKKAQNQIQGFLTRCADYGLLTKEQQKLLDRDAASVDPSTARTQRINNEKRKMELAKKIEYLDDKRRKLSAASEDENDELEELEREIYLEKVRMAILECIMGKKIMEQEIQLLGFAAMREQRQEKEEEKEAPKPLKVTRLTKDQLTGQIHAQKIPVSQTNAHMARLSHREQLRRDVFKAPSNGPTVSLDEYARQEMEDVQRRSEREKKSQEAQQKEEQLLLEDDEEALERKRKKDSAWDDWKDANPRGQGNMRRG